MAADEVKLLVALEAKLDSLEKQLKQAGVIADNAASSIEDRFAKLNPQIGANFMGRIVTALTAGGAIASIIAATSALAELGDRAVDLRMPVEQLQALSLAAKDARVSNEELNKALTTFTSVSKQTDDSGNKFYNSLRNISSGFVDAFKNADTQSDRLRVIGSALASTGDEVKRAQLTLTAFGSDSERLTQFFENGSDRISEFTRKAREWGIAIDDNMVRKAQEAQSTINLLASALGNKLLASIGDLLPALREFIPYLEKMGAAARDAVASFASPGSRPTATIKNEIADLEDAISEFTKKRDDLLAKRDRAPSGNFMNNFFGTTKDTIDSDISDLNQKLDQYGAVLARRRALLQSRLDGDQPPPATPTSAFEPRPDLGKPKENAFDRQVEQINKRIAAYQAETDTVGMNVEAKARARAEAELTEALLRSGIEINDQYAAKIDEVSAAFGRAAAATAAAKRDFEGANDAARFMGNQLSTALSNIDASTKGIDLLRSAVRNLANELIKAAITGEGAFAKILGFASNTGGTGGIVGSIMSLFGGARAGGGPVSDSRAYLIGEKGPEIFVPGSSGRIVPNSVMRSAGGGGDIVVSITSAPVFQAGMTPTDIAAIEGRLQQNNIELRQQVQADLRNAIRLDHDTLTRS